MTMTTFESMAQYGCDEGFTLSGSQSRTCQADGTWSGADPVCVVPPNSEENSVENSVENSQHKNSAPVIAGVVVGLVATALIALLIIVALILMRRHHRSSGADLKSNDNGNEIQDFNNPIYSGRERYIYAFSLLF